MSAIELIDFVDIGNVHDSTTANYRANEENEKASEREKELGKKGFSIQLFS